MQPYREKNIESDVLEEKITGYWGEMFEKNTTSNEMFCRQITSCISMIYIQ